MPNPFATLRDKIAPRLRALRQCLWHWKDVALLVLAFLLLAVSGYAFREPLSAALARVRAGATGETSPCSMVVDRQNRPASGGGEGGPDPRSSSGDDRAGSGRVLESVRTPMLRFQPNGGFRVASEYRIDLIPKRLLKAGQVFSGDTTVTVRTDKFLVEGIDWVEEPALEGKAKVVFRGEIQAENIQLTS